MTTEEKASAYDKALEQAKKELAVSSPDSDSARQIFRFFPELRKEEKPLTPFQQCLNCILRGVYYAEVPDEKVNQFIVDIVRTRTDELIKLAKKHEYTNCQLHENEDEMMLNTIIRGFKNWRASGHSTFNNTAVEDIIAYLEKQKDKMTKDEFENSDLFQLKLKTKYCDGYQDGIVQQQEKQKEQKPTSFNEHYNPYDLCPALGIDDCEVITEGNVTSLNKKEQKPIRDIISGDAIESCMLRYLQSAANRNDDIEIIEDTKKYKKELLEIIEKEQKPAEWSEEDSDNLERVDSYLWMLDDYVGDDCAMPQGKTDKIRGNIQEVLSPWLKVLPERFNFQSKVEWNEEDKRTINDILARLEDLLEDNTRTQVFKTTIKSDIDFLKLLRLQKLDASKLENFDPVDVLNRIKKEWPMVWEKVVGKQEWSDEDEKTLNAIIDMVGNSLYEPLRPRAVILSWLNSLRSQLQHRNTYYDIIHNILDMLNGMDFMKITPEHRVSLLNDIRVKCKDADECAEILDEPHWKPSEEQMDALNALNCHGDLSYVGQQNQLISLYNDLKKLM